ncbi:hypothetical protein EMA8858_03787 [Emticicia aquatica]|uniref:Uncharacterized protein n=2 Tax=Emticicia aquatica TaxID=1681835 RepID=A0ABM9AUN8_9BACT|nr:hypothetical protein EMA8858_03787 [Emticicia aquatica]
MKSYSNKLFILFFLLLSFSVSAQLTQGKRIEFERRTDIDEENLLIPMQENGVLLMQSKIEPFRRKFIIDFYKYDSTLTQIWRNSFVPEPELDLLKTFKNEHFFYVLFRKSDKIDIGVLRIDLETGDKTYVEGNLLTNMEIEHFVVLQSKAFIGGKFNDRPVVVMFSFFDKTSKVLPEVHSNNLVINELDVDEKGNFLYLMLKNDRNCQFILKKYSYEGKAISALALGDKQLTPISGEILNLDKDTEDQHPILMGNYAEGCSLFALGFYLKHLNDDSNIQYINFADLNHFFSFMNPKREEKIKLRIKQKKQKGKDIKLRYRLLLHDIIQTNDGWVMVAEVFYPEYKTTPSSTGWNNWRNYRIGNDVYNNFRYSHAIICGFDKNAKLIWDNSVSLKDIESSELNAKVQITLQDDYQILAYPDESLIRTVVIKGNEKVKNLENFDLKTNSETEKIVDTERTNLAAWYGHSFLAYGYQSVRKNNEILNNDVFYITKLTYNFKEENKN